MEKDQKPPKPVIKQEISEADVKTCFGFDVRSIFHNFYVIAELYKTRFELRYIYKIILLYRIATTMMMSWDINFSVEPEVEFYFINNILLFLFLRRLFFLYESGIFFCYC